MTHADDFNTAAEKYAGDNSDTFTKDNEVQLSVTQPGDYYAAVYKFNFLTRMVLCNAGVYEKKSGMEFIPFSQLDREVLEFMRDKLIELGGHPPALPAKEGTRSLITKGQHP